MEETAATGEGSTESHGGASRPAQGSGGELDDARRGGSSVGECSGSQRSSQRSSQDDGRGKPTSLSNVGAEAKDLQQNAPLVPPPLNSDGNGLSAIDGLGDEAMVDCLLWNNMMDSSGAVSDGNGLEPFGDQTLFDMATEQGGDLGVTIEEVRALFADGSKEAAADTATATAGDCESVRAAKVPATGDQLNSGSSSGIICSVPSNSPQRYEAGRTIDPPSTLRKTSMDEPASGGSRRNSALRVNKVRPCTITLCADMPLTPSVTQHECHVGHSAAHAKPFA